MVKRSVILRLNDILAAIDEVAEFLENSEFSHYENDVKTRRAVERCIEIISEASRHIPMELRNRFPDVPWVEVRGIGNVLRHEYRSVADFVIWRTATKHLKPLRSVIVEIREIVERDGPTNES